MPSSSDAAALDVGAMVEGQAKQGGEDSSKSETPGSDTCRDSEELLAELSSKEQQLLRQYIRDWLLEEEEGQAVVLRTEEKEAEERGRQQKGAEGTQHQEQQGGRANEEQQQQQGHDGTAEETRERGKQQHQEEETKQQQEEEERQSSEASVDTVDAAAVDPAAVDAAAEQVQRLYLPVFAWLRQLLLRGEGATRSAAAEQKSAPTAATSRQQQNPTKADRRASAADAAGDVAAESEEGGGGARAAGNEAVVAATAVREAEAAAAAAADLAGAATPQAATHATTGGDIVNGTAAAARKSQSSAAAAERSSPAAARGPATAAASRAPLLVGITGPQGCGKTSLVGALSYLLRRAAGVRCVTLSIDDFYLLQSRMEKLAKKYPENPLYQQRGNAGTHEVPLALCVLEALRQKPLQPQQHRSEPVLVPTFDKAAGGGQGERTCVKDWRRIDPAAVDVILFEGWLLGFKALPDADAQWMPSLSAEELTWMGPVNKALQEYAPLNALVDAWIVLQVEHLKEIYVWRREQEHALRRQRGAGMTDAQVHAFVNNFMPSYKAYLPGLYASPPAGTKGDIPIFRVELGQDRKPTRFEALRGKSKGTITRRAAESRSL